MGLARTGYECKTTYLSAAHMLIDAFNRTIDYWISELDQYTFEQLCAKPTPNAWSMGQMYRHLIQDTQYYIDEIRMCVAHNDHATEDASPNARAMFLNNDFPDLALKGSPANAFILQPNNKEELMIALLNIKTEMNNVAVMISASSYSGKTKHPGLNYFGASEWLQFADMHFRHHLRQKRRIDDFLKGSI